MARGCRGRDKQVESGGYTVGGGEGGGRGGMGAGSRGWGVCGGHHQSGGAGTSESARCRLQGPTAPNSHWLVATPPPEQRPGSVSIGWCRRPRQRRQCGLRRGGHGGGRPDGRDWMGPGWSGGGPPGGHRFPTRRRMALQAFPVMYCMCIKYHEWNFLSAPSGPCMQRGRHSGERRPTRRKIMITL